MKLRKKVTVEGTPIIWNSNLDDDNLRKVYAELMSDPTFSNSSTESSPTQIAIPFYYNTFEFAEGFCICVGSERKLTVIYRTAKEWELWFARQSEIEELEEEQRQYLKAEDELFRTEDEHLKAAITESLESREYEKVEALLNQRAALIVGSKRLPSSWLSERLLLDHAMAQFRKFPTTDAGVRFVTIHARNSYAFIDFANKFFWSQNRADENLWVELEKIFQAALTKHPSDAALYKWISLLWRKVSRLDRAIDCCHLALERGLRDDTKSGFAGRIERLRNEMAARRRSK